MECRFAQAAGPGWGKGLASEGRGLQAHQGPGCPRLQQVVARMTRFLWAKEAMTTSCCCPHSCVPGEGYRGGRTKHAPAAATPPGAPPSSCADTSPAPFWLPLLCGGLPCPLVWPGPLSKAFWRHCPPNRRLQTFGPLALRAQGPSRGPGAFCCPASERSALPRGPWPTSSRPAH